MAAGVPAQEQRSARRQAKPPMPRRAHPALAVHAGPAVPRLPPKPGSPASLRWAARNRPPKPCVWRIRSSPRARTAARLPTLTLPKAAPISRRTITATRCWRSSNLPVFYDQQPTNTAAALLGSARCYMALGDTRRGVRSYLDVQEQFPALPEAAAAKAEMEKGGARLANIVTELKNEQAEADKQFKGERQRAAGTCAIDRLRGNTSSENSFSISPSLRILVRWSPNAPPPGQALLRLLSFPFLHSSPDRISHSR